ncbi:hypothetical protein NL108_004129 [Boleophthalmus pectinirostris]|uniref:zinc finger and SCAN domain-containing protein 31-like n=1 Tax=Boleophthalmus pectinirostris TaxID=150288 RepID=UPI00242F0200|nr:zinc finger and SCAN domain-containing protein 31-like [Boleophthalmus pectinirostris]KAJ0066256.1 hypothetical protein NL108_004129 [Boleophthalmus pectinirostris]
MSKSQTLRALVNERLTAAAEEIFALFERTIAEYEEEVCRSKEENQRKQELLDSILSPSKSPGPGLNQDPSHTPRIKEEPEEPSIKQEEHTLLVQSPPPQVSVGVPESSAVCVKTEESSLLQQRQTDLREETQGENISTETHLHSETEGDTEHSSDTDNEDWRAPLSFSTAQMETDADGDHDNQVQNSGLSPKYKSAPETSATVNNRNMSGTAEGAKGKKHQCSVCQKRFGTKWHLQRHIIIHPGEKPFSCSTCEKIFNRKTSLDKHEKLHTKKPFSCSTCKRSFTSKGFLALHVKGHLDEKTYSCLICEKSFSQKCDLNKHVRTHTGERPYRCSTCEKTFSYKCRLNVHVKTHR